MVVVCSLTASLQASVRIGEQTGSGTVAVNDESAHIDNLYAAFLNPPSEARPWCYWWWINGHVDHETITADLESMKALGFGGVLMFDSRGYWDDDDHVRIPPAEVGWGTDTWYDNVEFSVRECSRLGLKFTMNASAS